MSVQSATVTQARPWRSLLGAVAFATLAVIPMYLLYGKFIVDDAYIFLSFARHYLERGEVALNPGEPINGITSPLWFIVALVETAVVRQASASLEAPVTAIRLLSGACTIWSIAAFHILVRRCISRRSFQLLALTLFLLNPWIWRWAFSGMESPLALALVTTGFLLAASPEPRGKRMAALVLLSLGILTRPELGALGMLFLIQYAISEDPRVRAGAVIRTGMVAAVPLVLWVAFAATHMTSVAPQSMLVKKGVLPPLAALMYALSVMVTSVPAGIILLGFGAPVLLWQKMSQHGLFPGVRSLRNLMTGPWVVHLAWGILLCAIYVAEGYVPLSRYLLLLVPGIVLGSVKLLEEVFHQSRPMALLRPLLFGIVVGVSVLSFGWVTIKRSLPASNGSRLSVYRHFGGWLKANTDPKARVAWVEIGALSYYSDRYVVDTMGLVLPREELAVLRSKGQDGLLQLTQPQYQINSEDLPVGGGQAVLSERSYSPLASEGSRQETLTLYKMNW